MAGMGLGSFLEGMSGGLQLGMSMERNKKVSDALENRQSQKEGGNATANSGTAIQNAAAQPGAFGLPGQPQPSATGAVGVPGYNPTQSPAMPSTPGAKAETNSNGNWATLAGYMG